MQLFYALATLGGGSGGFGGGGGFDIGPLAPVADVGLWAAFIAGIVSFISPCVLPLIPGYLSFISGVSIDKLHSREDRAEVVKKTALTSFIFVLGFSTVFILLGASATAVGNILKEYQDIISKVFSVIIFLLALHFLGVYRLKFLAFEKKVHATVKPLNLISIYLVGMAFAFGWSPCVGPLLASVLAMAATREQVGQGVMLLSSYSLGLGIPFMATAIALNSLLGVFGWVKRHFRLIEIISGILLIIVAVLMFFGQLEVLANRLVQ
ncbi:MAG TPA: cytochrome c biogenesis protein CcdA [candidate division Zixibacteria bacterium]|nr:cytochrome c biogenesis protein CcdA [candidate division Zixibacteria bacterium]HEQ99624.1 cytochrome c biogenesis protein CcdA [candidate division Zixibacteria bacterium]